MNPIAPYSFSAISHAVGAVASLVPAYLIYRSYRKKRNDFIKYFVLYFLMIGLGGLLVSLVEFSFPLDTMKQGIGVLFSTPFFYLSSAYFFMIPASLKFPKLKNIGFAVILFLGLVTFVISVINIQPTTIDDRGLISFDSPKYVDALFFLIFALAWLPAIVIFIAEAIKSKDKFIRIRSLLLSVGLLSLLIFGQMHDTVNTWQGFVVADVLTATSFLL